MQKTITFLTLLILFSVTQLTAQSRVTTTPNVSQKAIVGQTIGLMDAIVTYHRPAVKGREIMGKMIAYNTPWRAGANENTIISFSDKVKIEGKELAAGTYGLHLLPTEGEWTVIFSNNSTSWGSYSYNQAEDALRVNVKPQKSASFKEFLAFEFDEITSTSANCSVVWGDLKVGFNVESDVHEAVLANFKNELRDRAGWGWDGYNEAANYCLQNNVGLSDGMAWATRSVFMNPNGVNMLTKAQLTGKIQHPEDKAAAKKVALATLDTDLAAHNVTWKEYNTAAAFAMKQEAWTEAEKWINQSISMSSNMTSMMAKAKVFETKGDQKKAETIKKEAIDKGTDAELNMYAYQLMWSGKTKEAVEIFEANTEKNGSNPNTWDSLGEGYFNNGQKEDAIKAFKKCLSMNPPDAVKANTMRFLTQLEGAKP